MEKNAVIESILNRKSIRRYTDEMPSDEVIHTIVRAGQQAPFASQNYSVLLSRMKRLPFDAPLLFTICVDLHKIELIMRRRGWKLVSNDLFSLIFGIQDATLMAENMVTAAESLGLSSCFLGAAPYKAAKISQQYKLPKRVFPLVQLAMGYPAENPPVRPRYPLEFVLFEDAYPELSDDAVERAMQQMDEGYLAQDYYRLGDSKIQLEVERDETFDYENYSWTEHISRKWGQWHRSTQELLDQLELCGFKIVTDREPINEG
jgi:FMN reductase (NADPH)